MTFRGPKFKKDFIERGDPSWHPRGGIIETPYDPDEPEEEEPVPEVIQPGEEKIIDPGDEVVVDPTPVKPPDDPPKPSDDPPSEPDTPDDMPVIRVEGFQPPGWRYDIQEALKKLAAFGPYGYYANHPYVLTAMAMTESGGNKNAYNEFDGQYPKWGRQVASCGLFQIREPTGYYLYKNRSRIGSMSSNMNKLPLNPEGNKPLVTAALRQYPSSLYYGMVLLTLAAGTFVVDFESDTTGKITHVNDPENEKLALWLYNHANGSVSEQALFTRLFWMWSSKAGPRTMIAKQPATAEKVIKRFSQYIVSELALYQGK